MAELTATMSPPYVDAFVKFYVNGDLRRVAGAAHRAAGPGRPARSFAQWAAEHADAFRR